MVTAGVYLIVRTHPLFELAPNVQDLAAGLGALTLLMAGLIALVQTDIKRVIAYSTMSQIGYMFLGAGIGAYANAMFLLMAHAFFKALLFLGAGIVIHALARRAGHPQDGRPPEADAEDVVGDAGRRARARRDPAALRLLLEGLDPRRLARPRRLVRLPPLRGRRSPARSSPGSTRSGCCSSSSAASSPRTSASTRRTRADRLVELVDGPDGRRARRARGVRRVDPVRERAGRRSPTGSSRWREPLVEATGAQEAVASICAVALGLAGIGVAWWIYSAHRVNAPRPWADARAQVLLRRALQRPLLLARGRARAGPLLGRRGADRQRLDRGVAGAASAGRRLVRASSRPASSACTRSRSPPASPSSSSSSSRCGLQAQLKARLHHGWITTTLILLPLIGALVLWVVPMPRVWVAPAALAIALFEVGFWIEALVRFDFDRGGLQESNQRPG